MSKQTLAAVEDAITAHLKSVREEAGSYVDDNSVVVDWVVAVTLSKIDDDNDVVYRNAQFAPNNNPNGQSALHAWASAEIMENMAFDSEEDD